MSDSPWRPAKVGMKLDQRAEVRTGPRSEVTYRTADGGTFIQPRLQNRSVRDVVGDRAESEREDQTNPAIRSPGATLNIRGQNVSLIEQPATTRPAATQVSGSVNTDSSLLHLSVGSRIHHAEASRAETPPTRPAATQPVKWPVEIVEVQGIAQVRETAESPWRPVKVGTKVEQLAEVRTGPRTRLVLRDGLGQEAAADRLGTWKVVELWTAPKSVVPTTLPGDRWTPARVEENKGAHAAGIRSPQSTLRVRG